MKRPGSANLLRFQTPRVAQWAAVSLTAGHSPAAQDRCRRLLSARIANPLITRLMRINTPSSTANRTTFVGTNPSEQARPLEPTAILNMTLPPFACIHRQVQPHARPRLAGIENRERKMPGNIGAP